MVSTPKREKQRKSVGKNITEVLVSFLVGNVEFFALVVLIFIWFSNEGLLKRKKASPVDHPLHGASMKVSKPQLRALDPCAFFFLVTRKASVFFSVMLLNDSFFSFFWRTALSKVTQEVNYCL